MKRFLLMLTLWAGLSGPAVAQSSEIQSVIDNQMDAFLSDDFARAFTFASPNIRNLFRTPENFGSMVRNGYPMVWRPAEVRYLELREIAGDLWQMVQVTDAEGNVHLLDYQMIAGRDGWKINAVQLLQAPGVSA